MKTEYEAKFVNISVNDIRSTTQNDIEACYQEFVLPEFGINRPLVWERHIQTDPDNFLHIFTIGDIKYALGFDDYPSDFSVGHDKSVKAVRLKDGEKVLHVSTNGDKYNENITGYFMLFQVIDTNSFEKLVHYLEVAYDKLKREWQLSSSGAIVIARDILQLAETASQNHDSAALYSLQNILETILGLNVEDDSVSIELLDEYVRILLDAEFDYELYTIDDRERVGDEIYKSLSREVQSTITIQKYESENLGQTVRLVSAMYAKTEHDTTSGITVAIVFEDNKIKYPVDHFVNDELKKYFAENSHISRSNIERNMPETLQDYQLVKGSVEVQDVFPRELAYISY